MNIRELENILEVKTVNAKIYRSYVDKNIELNEEDEIELFSTSVNDAIRVIMPLKNILKKLEEGCNHLGITRDPNPCLRFRKKGDEKFWE